VLVSAAVVPLLVTLLLVFVTTPGFTWDHQPSHFWLVVVAGLVPAVLAWLIGDAALRRDDQRLAWMAAGFLTMAAFLVLHALATPKVLLDGPNAGFEVAMPVGLTLGAAMVWWSAAGGHDRDNAAGRRLARSLRWLVLVVAVLWGGASIAGLPPLDSAPQGSGSPLLIACAVVSAVLLLDAARRDGLRAVASGSGLVLAVAVAWLLLANAAVSGAFGRNWQAVWWEWHLLVLAAFVTVAVALRRLPEGERFTDLYSDEVRSAERQVSVLFADLEGYSGFSEGRDPAEVQEMLNDYFDAALPAIRRHGGQVDKLVGDAVMATFNVHTVVEDHALAACRAAIDLRDAFAAVAELHPDWPRFRIGVNTGVARVGVVGDSAQRQYAAVGDTVNVASRIEGQAPAGSIAVSGSTHDLIGRVDSTLIGTLAVKGRSTAVEIWELTSL
jgi:class 3 adenylate cyclase